MFGGRGFLVFWGGMWFVVVVMSGSARIQSSHCICKEAGPGFYFPPGFSRSVKAAKGRGGPSSYQQGAEQRGRCPNHRVFSINSSKI